MYLEQDRPEPMEKGAPRYLSEAELWSLHDDALWPGVTLTASPFATATASGTPSCSR